MEYEKTEIMKTLKELKLTYPKCFKPLHRLKVKKIVGYKNRPTLDEWKIKISKN